MVGLAYLIFLGTVLLVFGVVLGHFLTIIPIVVLVVVGIILLFLIFRADHTAEAGIASFFMVIAVLLVIITMFITALIEGKMSLW